MKEQKIKKIKKSISLDPNDVKKIEKIGQRNNLNFSETIKFLLDSYDNRLSKHIVRSNENKIILLMYKIMFQKNFLNNKEEINNLEKLVEYFIKGDDIINKIKMKKLKEFKENKKTIKKNNKEPIKKENENNENKE
jgi:hypothetical protein